MSYSIEPAGLGRKGIDWRLVDGARHDLNFFFAVFVISVAITSLWQRPIDWELRWRFSQTRFKAQVALATWCEEATVA